MRSIKSYIPIVGAENVDHLRQLSHGLRGARIVHVNSTRVGGGVAEIMEWLIPLMNDLGLNASWEVIEGNDPFFNVTKAFHNGLQGKSVTLTSKMIADYESTVTSNAERLRPILEEADFVFIHDPQPAMLFDLCPNRRGKWIWRCHVDVSKPNRGVWNYLRKRVSGYDASIFSMPAFAQPLPHPQFIIAPSIDPLSEKNCDLPQSEVAATLERFGIPSDRPILTQVSRFDQFKDPIGVIKAFQLLKEHVDARLVLVGGGASDDPEGAAVFEEVLHHAENDPFIHALLLPGDSHRTINALQRASAVIIQKSLQEGFGLTVTEGLWKSIPVIGGNVGGIRLQVHDYHTGFLVNSPEGASLRLRYLLHHPDAMQRMGEKGKEFVRVNFLLHRHLREYLTLMLGIRRDLANLLLAGEG